ncbi:MAG: anaerobic ribonucleoside-triphosphate reductase activating protein [Lachnospiraceae bacterium]|nr:anaerobic ribonucleoside-triphosphate reductase activating protein [Lachnospiraceae bacterium]
MLICGFNKTTLLDYPEHVAATVFLGGCNFRCPFCQNRDLLLQPAEFAAFTEAEIFDHLKKRRSMLSGVCVSGGEPTIYQKDLPDFLARIKELGYLIKLDTNGTNPALLRELYNARLIDYVAMDIKTGPSDYGRVAGLSEIEGSIFTASGQDLLENVKESVHFLMNETDSSVFTYEFRTTVVRELHNEDSFAEIANWIKGATHYYLQSYKDSENVLCPGFHAYTKDELEAFAGRIRPMIPSVALRGVD